MVWRCLLCVLSLSGRLACGLRSASVGARRGIVAAYVAIIPWPQAAMAARRMRSGFLRRAQKPLYAQYNVHFVDIIPWPQAAMLWLRRDAYFRAEEWLAYAHRAKDAV